MNLQQFLADPRFQVSTLTAAIEEMETAPTMLASMGIFQEEGISTTTFELEFDGETLSLVMPGIRGESVAGQRKPNAKLITFSTIHLPVPFNIKADEITNVKAFGKQTEVDVVSNNVNKHLRRAKERLKATREMIRAGAVTGRIMDAQGTVLLDIADKFDITKEVHLFDKAAKKTRDQLREAKRLAKKNMGMVVPNGWYLMCGSDYWADFIEADDVVRAQANKNGTSNDLADDLTDGMNIFGVTAFCYDASVMNEDGDEVDFVPKDKAYLFPRAAGLFIGRNAPADYVETVGTEGLPFYSRLELSEMGKGIKGEAQSNPLYIPTRPKAIQEFTITPPAP